MAWVKERLEITDGASSCPWSHLRNVKGSAGEGAGFMKSLVFLAK
jgi:hypothetical protein